MSKKTNNQPSRDKSLRDIWIKNGMPERMIIHVGRETIKLIDGMAEVFDQDAQKLTGNRASVNANEKSIAGFQNKHCKICGAEFKANHGRTKLCSNKCRKINASELAKRSKEKHAEEILARMYGPGNNNRRNDK